MKRAWLCLIIVIPTLYSSAGAALDENWAQRMRDLADSFSGIFLFLAGEDSIQPARLVESSRRIAELASAVEVHVDPSQRHAAELLRARAQAADLFIRSGNPEYGRTLLRASFATCMTCHSTGPNSPPLSAFAGWQKKFSREPWNRRVEMALTLGQPDSAVAIIQGELRRENSPISALELDSAVRWTLTGLMRAKKDGLEIRRFLEEVAGSEYAGSFLKATVRYWMADLDRLGGQPAPEPQETVARAREILGTAAADENSAFPRQNEVVNLTAAVWLGEFVRENPKSSDLAEAYYLLGVAYDGMRDLGLWALHEMYYEDCIRRAPHTALAGKCFSRYEQAVFEGSGRFYNRSPFLETHIDELRSLAEFPWSGHD